jgi:prepilin-type N-terminal cleavage/methylation domain-containing protein
MKNRKGFTLIELMIVVAILGTLAAILIPAFCGRRVAPADFDEYGIFEMLSPASAHAMGNAPASPPKSTSGVKKVRTKVQTGPDGQTSEQRNIVKKLKEDNKPGAIKHLYVFSAYSGQCILYSTVKGKVTSSGKRLSPNTVNGALGGTNNNYNIAGIPLNIGGRVVYTEEVLQDDGTYGSSIPYLYWWDVRGISHKHYVSGGQIVHISDQPMTVKNIIINIETQE